MKLNELPQAIQDMLNADRDEWKGTITQDGYHVMAYNKTGTRFFMANRHCVGWQDNETGNSMPFGGGSYWKVAYGVMNWQHTKHRNPLGEVEDRYEWVRGKTFGSVAKEDGTSVVIPNELCTKKEVMTLMKELGFKGFTDLRSK